jgi:Signal transduction histidine kinase
MKSLYMKLVLIMVALILSLMAVVGAFLTTSVERHYLQDFYQQMSDVFSNETLYRDLTSNLPDEEDGAAQIWQILSSYSAALGLDSRSRTCYVLDGHAAQTLAGSNNEAVRLTNNLATALSGAPGDEGSVTADYMDVAIPIERGGSRYIIYVYDNRQLVEDLNASLFDIILNALFVGLIISVALALLLAKTLITPIEKLTEGAKRVASGDLSRRLEVSSTDELGVLTDNFNNMANQLQETIHQVENERNKLDTLFLHMTDGVLAFNKKGLLIHSNPAAAELLGVPLDESTRYAPLFGKIVRLPDLFLMGTSDFAAGERIIDGRHLEVFIAPFAGVGQGGAIAVLHDVTQSRKNEELRREFVANVSHELRTPLTNIRSYAETISESPDMPEEMQQNFLGVILKETDRMTHIVQDLLTLSRYDSGKVTLRLAPFSLTETVTGLVEAVRLEAEKRRHILTLCAAEPLTITGDRERMMQVIMNILSNAIKYTPNDGRIDVTVARLDTKRVQILVSDNGIGIPAADRSRIFERFYRVDKARSRESGGTGLGLAIAKEIVELHGGSIELLEHDDPGLTVSILLLIGGPAHG